MTDYIGLNDLKSALISIIVFFVCVGIQRYWSNRSVKILKRRIERAELWKAELDRLARSEREVLLFTLPIILAQLSLMCLTFAIQILSGRPNVFEMISAALWVGIGGLAFYVVTLLKNIVEYPRSAEEIEKKIAKLKSKLAGWSRVRS
jgi:hypothetical protein